MRSDEFKEVMRKYPELQNEITRLDRLERNNTIIYHISMSFVVIGFLILLFIVGVFLKLDFLRSIVPQLYEHRNIVMYSDFIMLIVALCIHLICELNTKSFILMSTRISRKVHQAFSECGYSVYDVCEREKYLHVLTNSQEVKGDRE